MADVRNLHHRLGKGRPGTGFDLESPPGRVELMCTAVGVIRKGKIVAEGTVGPAARRDHLSRNEEHLKEDSKSGSHRRGRRRERDRVGRCVVHRQGRPSAQPRRSTSTSSMRASRLRSCAPTGGSLEDIFMELTGTEGGL